jgi:deazaflavin-dependent oxidoreductase (nitroreductase family)
MAGSRFWTGAFRVLFLTTPTPVIRQIRNRYGYGPIEELVVRGRKTGTERHLFVVVARTDDGWIVGHPNGGRAQWVRNLEAAGEATVIDRHGAVTPVRATLLPPGPERDAAIAEQARQQVAGPRQVYTMARSHIREVGALFRLDPIEPMADAEASVSAEV